MIDYEEDAGLQPVTEDQLKNIAQLALDMLLLQDTVNECEEALKQAKANLRQVQEGKLPEAMAACSMEKFTLANGMTIAVKETLYASIPQKNKPEAAKWLIDHELAPLVKADVVVSFDGGQHEQVQSLVALFDSNGISNYSVGENMNTASVKSAIKELMAEGKDVPLELFGAYFARKAEVK